MLMKTKPPQVSQRTETRLQLSEATGLNSSWSNTSLIELSQVPARWPRNGQMKVPTRPQPTSRVPRCWDEL